MTRVLVCLLTFYSKFTGGHCSLWLTQFLGTQWLQWVLICGFMSLWHVYTMWHVYAGHYSITPDNRTRDVHYLEPWDMTRETPRERDRWPTALIVSVADTSNNQHLYWHTIQISSHRHLWYCSRHCLFDVPHVCHKVTVPHPPPPPPHIHN